MILADSVAAGIGINFGTKRRFLAKKSIAGLLGFIATVVSGILLVTMIY